MDIFQRFPKIGDLFLSDLDLPTLLNCTMVCKDWNSFLSDPFFWLKKLRDVGQPTEIETSWKNLITKSVEIGVDKQVFAKCLMKKFQHFVESHSKKHESQKAWKKALDTIMWMKFPPLHTASMYGQNGIVNLIYHLELDFNRPLYSRRYGTNEYYEMPIFAAIENGHTDIVKFLANTSKELQNPSINHFGKPLIYEAILHKNFDLVKFLLPRIQNVNKIYGTDQGVNDSLIHACIRSGDINILKYLLSIPGIDPNIQNSYFGEKETALQMLCRRQFISNLGIPLEVILEMVKILAPLVDANHPMNFDYGKSPIHLAVEFELNDILKILVNHLNSNVKNHYADLLPIDVAVLRNNVEAIKILAPFTRELKIIELYYYPHNTKNTESIELMKSLIEQRMSEN